MKFTGDLELVALFISLLCFFVFVHIKITAILLFLQPLKSAVWLQKNPNSKNML